MTKAIERKLEKNPLYSNEDKSLAERAILVKFFTPDSNWTWYVLEGEKQSDGDWLFFGYVQGFENEYGNFMFSELTSARGPLGLSIERDLYFEDRTMMDVKHAEGIAA